MPWKDLGKVVGSNGTVGNVDSTYINNGGDPGVSITRSGDDTAPDITFNFENLVNDPLTESEIEQITNDVSVNSSHTANGTVLTSIWAGIKAKFAAKSHVHDASDITTGQLAAALIANGTITEEMLAAAAVSTGKIGAKAVTEAKLGDGAVATAKLADDAVTADKLADGSVGIAHLDEEMAAGWESLSQPAHVEIAAGIDAYIFGRIAIVTWYFSKSLAANAYNDLTPLPVGIRPLKNMYFTAETSGSIARVHIATNGRFAIYPFASSAQSQGTIIFPIA